MSTRKEALGRGLGALLGSKPVSITPEKKPASAGPAIATEPGAGERGDQIRVTYVALSKIRANPRQPRGAFSEESLQDLADSIREHGVLQPILVTKDDRADGYILIAGERRFRAAEKAGLREIPAILQDVSDEEMLEIAIVENVQRDDLNPVEEARAYRSLIDLFGWSQEQVAQRVGKRRSTIANSLRLLRLGSDALADLEQERMTPGHARAILSIDDSFYRQKLRVEVVEKGISVREAEKRAQAYQKAGPPTHRAGKKGIPEGSENLDTVALEERLMAHLGCRVKIRSRDGRSGSLEIPFRNPDELERFFQAIQFEF